jgi:hypothetical protein
MADRQKWCYLVVFSPAAGSHARLRDYIDTRPEILNWKSYFPRMFLLVSRLTASALTDLLRTCTEDDARFVVVDTSRDCNGRLPQGAWDLIQKPRAITEGQGKGD